MKKGDGMKKVWLAFLFTACFIGNAYSVEILVKNNSHWMDSLTSEEVSKMTPEAKQGYEARAQKGDPIVVRPDGWNWGKDERDTKLFTILKAPGMTETEAKIYEQSLTTDEIVSTEYTVSKALWDNPKEQAAEIREKGIQSFTLKETLTGLTKKQVLEYGKTGLLVISDSTITGDYYLFDIVRTKPILKRVRKHSIPSTLTAGAVSGTATTTKTTLQSQIITKTGAPSEVIQPKSDLLKTGWKKIKPPLMVAYHFWIENAWAATQLLKTVKPSGGDYTSLEACMNANEQDLTAADKYFDVEIDGTWSSADTSAVTIHNYTTDATRYINIYTTSAARHLGVWSTSYYRLEVSAYGDRGLIQIESGFVYLTGLQVQGTLNASHGHGIYQNGGGSDKIIRCIIKGVLTNNNGYWNIGLVLGGAAGSSTAYNNIIYGWNGSDNDWGIYIGSYDGIALNNTVYGCRKGIKGTDTNSIIKNNIAYNNGTDYTDTFDATSTNNLSKDTTAPALNTYYISKTLTFTNTTAGSEDLHLVAGDTDAIDKGADLSATFTDDIDGVTRSGTWDIGADEYVSAEPPAGVIKSIWGINLSDIKKINGIDIGDIKQINGLTTQ